MAEEGDHLNMVDECVGHCHDLPKISRGHNGYFCVPGTVCPEGLSLNPLSPIPHAGHSHPSHFNQLR